ncbi:MAG TPA: glutamine synthetase family protein [Beijerinckiaceae bacterium]|jgi:glutamine synthetase
MSPAPFIARHGLWTDEQTRAAAQIAERLPLDDVHLVRLAWADPHGYSRAKALTVPAFLSALKNGHNINVATSTLDSAGARTFSSFTRGGGMGLDEMTGSPNLTLVPDPLTFRILPWAPGVAWVIGDEYFDSGKPFHFSPRQLLRREIAKLAGRGLSARIGLEIEFYLLRLAQEELTFDNVGAPGLRGAPVATRPIEPGYHFHSETSMDMMQPILSALVQGYEALGLPIRSIEKEWGPGQIECTFAPEDALRAADDALLFRTATKQICRRMGCFATFMARPGLKGYYSSGWHLHQSIVDAAGANVFMPDAPGAPLSRFGLSYVAGLMRHAAESAVFAAPTVTGYRRFKPNSLAPDRASWGYDHRGAMIRVLGGVGDPATRLENRIGEPSANPYLYIASQLAAGMAGVDANAHPGAQDDEPYAADRPRLPTSLVAALDELDRGALFRDAWGDLFVDYYLKVKRVEAGRCRAAQEASGEAAGDEPSAWEQNEYFDFF